MEDIKKYVIGLFVFFLISCSKTSSDVYYTTFDVEDDFVLVGKRRASLSVIGIDSSTYYYSYIFSNSRIGYYIDYSSKSRSFLLKNNVDTFYLDIEKKIDFKIDTSFIGLVTFVDAYAPIDGEFRYVFMRDIGLIWKESTTWHCFSELEKNSKIKSKDLNIIKTIMHKELLFRTEIYFEDGLPLPPNNN